LAKEFLAKFILKTNSSSGKKETTILDHFPQFLNLILPKMLPPKRYLYIYNVEFIYTRVNVARETCAV